MWDVGLAKMFEERNNENRIGNCIGTVISPTPLQVEILDGDIILQEKQLYIANGLLEKEYKVELMAGDDIGDITVTSKPSNPLISINIDDKDKTKLTLYFELKAGDEVLLIPTENEQVFCIVDVVKKVGG